MGEIAVATTTDDERRHYRLEEAIYLSPALERPLHISPRDPDIYEIGY